LIIDAFQPRRNRGRCDEEGVGRLFEGPATRSTKLEDRHALIGAVMRPVLRRDLRYSGILDAELFAQQGTRFVEPIVFRRESHPRIDILSAARARAYTMA